MVHFLFGNNLVVNRNLSQNNKSADVSASCGISFAHTRLRVLSRQCSMYACDNSLLCGKCIRKCGKLWTINVYNDDHKWTIRKTETLWLGKHWEDGRSGVDLTWTNGASESLMTQQKHTLWRTALLVANSLFLKIPDKTMLILCSYRFQSMRDTFRTYLNPFYEVEDNVDAGDHCRRHRWQRKWWLRSLQAHNSSICFVPFASAFQLFVSNNAICTEHGMKYSYAQLTNIINKHPSTFLRIYVAFSLSSFVITNEFSIKRFQCEDVDKQFCSFCFCRFRWRRK